jgi:hypothetical protein
VNALQYRHAAMPSCSKAQPSTLFFPRFVRRSSVIVYRLSFVVHRSSFIVYRLSFVVCRFPLPHKGELGEQLLMTLVAWHRRFKLGSKVALELRFKKGEELQMNPWTKASDWTCP